MINLLLVEDDRGIVDHLREFLRPEGFLVDAAGSRAEAMEKLQDGRYELALLDVSLPDGNGYALCRAIKDQTDLPVIFLTASGDEYSVVNGFDVGADDYVAKPFRPRELVSRIRNVLRRTGRSGSVLECGGLVADTARGVVTKNGRELVLSALEYRLLLVFLHNCGAVLTRNRLLEEIWDAAGEYVNDNTLTVYIKRLRDKIEEDPQSPSLLKTVRGLGYRMEEM